MTLKGFNGCHYWDDFFFQKLVQLINSDLSDTSPRKKAWNCHNLQFSITVAAKDIYGCE
jgi:hypothetical protein